jgi:hypothetical protein
MDFRPWVLQHKRRSALLLAAFVLIVSLSGVASWPDEIRGMRYVTEQDEVYRYIAQQLAEPSICEKIPWSVKVPGGFFIEPSYDRSDCYDFIAGRTRNPWLCWKVKRLGAFSLINEQTSAFSCLRNALRGMNGGVGVNPATLVTFFGRLGYDLDTIQSEGITPPVVNLRDAYRQLPARPDIVERIEKAIGSSGPLPATDRDASEAYLADMAALAAKDSRWCDRIPADLHLAAQQAGFRDWCRFTIASNTKNPSLCRNIPIPANQRDPRFSLEATCLSQANSKQTLGQYGPEVPDLKFIEPLFTQLGYEIPKAKDLPPEQIYTACDNFLDELNKKTDAQHLAARRRFIERVLRMP